MPPRKKGAQELDSRQREDFEKRTEDRKKCVYGKQVIKNRQCDDHKQRPREKETPGRVPIIMEQYSDPPRLCSFILVHLFFNVFQQPHNQKNEINYHHQPCEETERSRSTRHASISIIHHVFIILLFYIALSAIVPRRHTPSIQ